jgi:hypothetical protein
MLEYFLIGIFTIIISIIVYIKLKYPFWNIQPVYHSYDFWRYFSQTPFIIQRKLPVKTKFYDNKHVETIDFSDMKDFHMTRMIDLLQCHYLKSEKLLFTIAKEAIEPLFIGHSHPCYVSFFNEVNNEKAADETGDKVEPIGAMTSRPILLYLHQENRFHNIYLWDLICINRHDIHKNIDRNLIQTHEYNQRFRNLDISASLLKKEAPLHEGVVPLVEFTTSIFLLRSKIVGPRLPPHHFLTNIEPKNASDIYDFINEMRTLKSIALYPELGSIFSLLKSRRIFIYALKCKDVILGLYFFRNSNMLYEEGGQMLESISTLWNPSVYQNFQEGIKMNMFFIGFLLALKQAVEHGKNDKIQYKFIKFNRLGDSPIILEKWKQKYAPVHETQAAYYLYNMVVPGMPFLNQDCFILI